MLQTHPDIWTLSVPAIPVFFSPLQLDIMEGLHLYSSKPEAGMPFLPCKDNSIRRATDEPWFEAKYTLDGAEFRKEV